MGTYRKRRRYLEFDKAKFPELTDGNHSVTSDPDDEQNCIAYAADDLIRWWWPNLERKSLPSNFVIPRYYYWPPGCPDEETVEAFVAAFKTVGFEECDKMDDGTLEKGYQKIAIYALSENGKDIPQHAAKQSPVRNGKWRSKMGMDEDIEHDLAALFGPEFGRVVKIMCKPLSKSGVRKLIKKLKTPSIAGT